MKKIIIVIFILMLKIPIILSAQDISSYAGPLINDPQGLAFDLNKNLFVANGINNNILKIDTNGTISVIAGTGASGFSGDSGLATNALLNQPGGLKIDKHGNIIFTDNGNNRVRKIDIATGIITTIAGGGIGSDGSLATAAFLSTPNHICYDKVGNLFITETGTYFRIQKIDTFGIITTIAGNGLSGIITGDGGPATSARCFPIGICIDSFNNIYFTQNGGAACSIRKINEAGSISTIAGDSAMYYYNGDGMPASNAHLSPWDITVDKNNNLIITDIGNNRVRKIDTGGVINTIAGNGISGFGGDNGPATSAELWNISGLTFDFCGNLYISDINNSRIRKVTFDTSCHLATTKLNETEINSVTIYPNPATTVINVDGITGETKYRIYSSIGNIEQTGILKVGNNRVTIKTLTKGLHLIEITDSEGMKIIKKFIKE